MPPVDKWDFTNICQDLINSVKKGVKSFDKDLVGARHGSAAPEENLNKGSTAQLDKQIRREIFRQGKI